MAPPSAAGAEVSDALAPLREELAALSTEVARQKRALADVRARAGAPATDEAPATEKEVQSRAIDVGSPTATVKGAQGGGERRALCSGDGAVEQRQTGRFD